MFWWIMLKTCDLTWIHSYSQSEWMQLAQLITKGNTWWQNLRNWTLKELIPSSSMSSDGCSWIGRGELGSMQLFRVFVCPLDILEKQKISEQGNKMTWSYISVLRKRKGPQRGNRRQLLSCSQDQSPRPRTATCSRCDLCYLSCSVWEPPPSPVKWRHQALSLPCPRSLLLKHLYSASRYSTRHSL